MCAVYGPLSCWGSIPFTDVEVVTSGVRVALYSSSAEQRDVLRGPSAELWDKEWTVTSKKGSGLPTLT